MWILLDTVNRNNEPECIACIISDTKRIRRIVGSLLIRRIFLYINIDSL